MKRLVCLLMVVITITIAVYGNAEVLPTANYILNIYLCGIVDPDGADRTGWQYRAGLDLNTLSNSVVYKRTAFSKNELASYIRNSDVFLIHTHGKQDGKGLKCISNTGATSWLTTSDINSWTSGALQDLDVAYIGACCSGAGGLNSANIVNSLYHRGTQCAIGYLTEVKTVCNYTMLESFGMALGMGYRISDALTYADARVLAVRGRTGNTNLRLVRGDTYKRFFHSTPPTRNDMEINSDEYRVVDGCVPFINENGIFGYFDFNKATSNNRRMSPLSRDWTVADKISIAKTYVNDFSTEPSKYSLGERGNFADSGLYYYVFDYCIDNIKTGDYITVVINDDNELVSLAKPAEGMFDAFDIDYQQLEKVRSKLDANMREQGHTDYVINEERIIQSNGVFCIEFCVSYNIVENDGTLFGNDSIILEIGG